MKRNSKNRAIAGFEALETRLMMAAQPLNPTSPVPGLSGLTAPAIKSTYVNGSSFTLQSVNEPIAIFEFGASWCPWCSVALPLLQSVQNWAGQNDKPVQVMSINEQDTPATVNSEWASDGLSLPVVMDPTGNIFNDYATPYGAGGIPFIVVVAGDKIVWQQDGYSPDLDTTLEAEVNSIAADLPAPQPPAPPTPPTPPTAVLAVSDPDGSISNGQAISLGTTTQGSSDPTETFTVCNEGSTSMKLGTVSVPKGFVLSGKPATSLAPGACTSFTLKLDTTNQGSFSGSVKFNDTVGTTVNPFSFTVNGTVNAPAPAMAVTVPGGSISNGQTNAINLGTATKGAAQPSETFTVCNEGTTAMKLGAVSLPKGFVLAGKPAATLAPGACTSFTVKLNTAAVGSFGGMVSIAGSVGGKSQPFTFQVAGSVTAAVPPAITSVNHATFTVGQSGTFTMSTSGFSAGNMVYAESGKLPAGVTFNAKTGTLSGTPAAGTAGSYVLQLSASSGALPKISQTFTLTVGIVLVPLRPPVIRIM